MAEIIRTETRTRRRSVMRTRSEELNDSAQVHTVVRSIHGRTASMVRDFVAALDAAAAPDGAYLEAIRDEPGHLVGLKAEWITYPDDEGADRG